MLLRHPTGTHDAATRQESAKDQFPLVLFLLLRRLPRLPFLLGQLLLLILCQFPLEQSLNFHWRCHRRSSRRCAYGCRVGRLGEGRSTRNVVVGVEVVLEDKLSGVPRDVSRSGLTSGYEQDSLGSARLDESLKKGRLARAVAASNDERLLAWMPMTSSVRIGTWPGRGSLGGLGVEW